MTPEIRRMLTLLGAKMPDVKPDPLRKDLELLALKLPDRDKKTRLSYLEVRTNGDFGLLPNKL